MRKRSAPASIRCARSSLKAGWYATCRKRRGEAREEVLVAGLAGAEHHQLRSTVLQEAGQHRHAEIESLLPGQPRDDAEDRHLAPPGQPHRGEQLLLAALLPREILRGETVLNARVALGAPLA